MASFPGPGITKRGEIFHESFIKGGPASRRGLLLALDMGRLGGGGKSLERIDRKRDALRDAD